MSSGRCSWLIIRQYSQRNPLLILDSNCFGTWSEIFYIIYESSSYYISSYKRKAYWKSLWNVFSSSPSSDQILTPFNSRCYRGYMKLMPYLIKMYASAVTLLALLDNSYDIKQKSIAQLHSVLFIRFQTKGEKGGYCWRSTQAPVT